MTTEWRVTERMPRAEPIAPDASGIQGPPRLVVPAGWVIDEAARERLQRQLRRTPAHVAGVVAPVTPLPPGASHRVVAEWHSLEPLDVVAPVEEPVRGAALLRPHTAYRVGDGTVDVAGDLVVDRGATVHDPFAPVGPIEVASPLGRPPFPRRPVVLFLACEPLEQPSRWAHRMTNRLVRRDVEARLAVTTIADGQHLTRPVLPCAETVAALAPDVVVTLDTTAAAVAAEWCGTKRETVIVDFVTDTSFSVELVSWRVGVARGRLRARVTPRVETANLVRLVHRLCAGPQPLPPNHAAPVPITAPVAAPARRTRATNCIVVTSGDHGTDSETRVAAFVDHLGGAGLGVDVCKTTALRDTTRSADVVVLMGSRAHETAAETIDARRRAGRPTVVDLGVADVGEPGTSRGVALSPAALHAVQACRLVTSDSAAICHTAREAGARTLVVPTLPTRARYTVLRHTSELIPLGTIGWYAGAGGAHDGAAEGLAKVLAERSSARCEIVGTAEKVPDSLLGHSQVRVLNGPPEPGELSQWTLQVWSPASRAGQVVDGVVPFVDATTAGVPSVMTAAARASLDGWYSDELVVENPSDPDEWARRIAALLDDESKRAYHGSEARRRARALYSPEASSSAFMRLLGWLSTAVER